MTLLLNIVRTSDSLEVIESACTVLWGLSEAPSNKVQFVDNSLDFPHVCCLALKHTNWDEDVKFVISGICRNVGLEFEGILRDSKYA